MSDRDDDVARLEALLDRHGAELRAWPDPAAAQWARELALADPRARRALDEARQLDVLLDAHAEQFASDPALIERTVAAVAAALPVRRDETRAVLMRLAASFLLAAMVGGAAAQAVQPSAEPDEPELVMLESLLYGPVEGELQ